MYMFTEWDIKVNLIVCLYNKSCTTCSPINLSLILWNFMLLHVLRVNEFPMQYFQHLHDIIYEIIGYHSFVSMGVNSPLVKNRQIHHLIKIKSLEAIPNYKWPCWPQFLLKCLIMNFGEVAGPSAWTLISVIIECF